MVLRGVIAWTGRDGLVVACDPGATPTGALSRLLDPRPVQLQLELDDPPVPLPTSSGLTWATWVLPSIPTHLRDRPLGEAAAAVAAAMGEVAA